MNQKAVIGLLIAGFICLAVGLLIKPANEIVDMPDVYFSYSTNECVKVQNYGTNYDCNNLPTKYNNLWVR